MAAVGKPVDAVIRPLVSQLTPAAQRGVLGYRSLSLSAIRLAEIRPTAEDAVAAVAPACTFLAARLMVVVVGYLDWVLTIYGSLLAPDTLFHPALIRQYIHRPDSGLADRTLRDYRNTLLRISELFPTDDPVTFPALNGQSVSTPYSQRDMQLLRSWARGQSTRLRRRNASVLVALGAGAGLEPAEMQRIRRCDLTVDEKGVLVHVPGAKVRMVPVLEELEWLLLDAVTHLDGNDLVFGSAYRQDGSANIVTAFIRKSDRGSEPDPSANRLRATWIVTQLAARSPMGPFMTAAGLTKVQHLLDMLVHVPDLDTASHRRELRRQPREFSSTPTVTLFR